MEINFDTKYEGIFLFIHRWRCRHAVALESYYDMIALKNVLNYPSYIVLIFLLYKKSRFWQYFYEIVGILLFL